MIDINTQMETPAGFGTFQYGMDGGKLVFRINQKNINYDYLEVKERCMTDLDGNSALFYFFKEELPIR